MTMVLIAMFSKPPLSLQLDDLQVCFPSNKLTLGSPPMDQSQDPEIDGGREPPKELGDDGRVKQ